jgi:hypothetical protein
LILDSNRWFFKGIGQLLVRTVFGFWIFWFFPLCIASAVFWNWIIYINQLLTQNYSSTTARAIAVSPFFNFMVNTAFIVKHRSFSAKINVHVYGKFTKNRYVIFFPSIVKQQQDEKKKPLNTRAFYINYISRCFFMRYGKIPSHLDMQPI